MHQRKHGDLSRSAALHAAVMRGIADGDEARALKASEELMRYAEAVTRGVIEDDLLWPLMEGRR
jgi:hypothetical protein